MEIKSYLKLLATGGQLSRIPFSSVLLSAVALPFIFLFNTALKGYPHFVILAALILVLVCVAITHFAVTGEHPANPKDIFLDQACGVLISFLFVPSWAKLMVFGFVLFHVMSFLKRFVKLRGWAAKLHDLPGALGLFVDDLLIGLLVNLYLHLMIWIVR